MKMRFSVVVLFAWGVVGANAATCPDGYITIGNPYVVIADTCSDEAISVGVVADCADGDSVCWVVERLRALCGAGIDKIKTSTGVVVPLYSGRVTTPSFCVRYNDTVCYADMVLGRASGAVNVEYGDAVYHLE